VAVVLLCHAICGENEGEKNIPVAGDCFLKALVEINISRCKIDMAVGIYGVAEDRVEEE
jgi:hypothetical protein